MTRPSSARRRDGGAGLLLAALAASALAPACVGEPPEAGETPRLCVGGSCDDSLGLTLHVCTDEDAASGAYGCREASAAEVGIDPAVAVSPARIRFVTRGLGRLRGVALELRIYDGDSPRRALPVTDLADGRHGLTWDGRDETGELATAPFHLVRLEARIGEQVARSEDHVLATLFNLPDEGTGYYHFRGTDRVDRDDWGRGHVVDAIVAAGEGWGRPHRIGIGDLSLQNGGRFPPHVTHRHGECIDIRYVSRDGEEPLDLSTRAGRASHDAEASQELVDALVALGAEEVLADSRSGLRGEAVRFVSGHANHLHVVFPLFPEDLGG